MTTEPPPQQAVPTVRQKIVLAAAHLLEAEGPEAVSARAVAARAGVPTPSIFRIFGDTDGLLEEVAEHGFRHYLAAKAEVLAGSDPVQALRDAWDLHVRFGLDHPRYYALVYGQVRPGHLPRAGLRTAARLRGMVARVAAAGRLRTSVESATQVLHSGGVGTVLTLTALPEDERDLRISAASREMALAALTLPPAAAGAAAGVTAPGGAVAYGARALTAALGREGTELLSAAERALLAEWLDRLSGAHRSAGS
ncbi:TetR/AcrR family transcriptional regulator [Actinacidiphila sp. bgisy144]|uniref:TetR/AcrR family transcriptional regulator n=1 Tax=Actinacidiphila sp. bgisy144 TaxID=3413791 RepID=UPI003EBA2B0A